MRHWRGYRLILHRTLALCKQSSDSFLVRPVDLQPHVLGRDHIRGPVLRLVLVQTRIEKVYRLLDVQRDLRGGFRHKTVARSVVWARQELRAAGPHQAETLGFRVHPPLVLWRRSHASGPFPARPYRHVLQNVWDLLPVPPVVFWYIVRG